MPQTPMMSARGARGTASTFSSTISTSHDGGVSAASVASPRGGLTARLRGRISSTAQRKLQKLSGERGLISSRRMRVLRREERSYPAPTRRLAAELDEQGEPCLLARDRHRLARDAGVAAEAHHVLDGALDEEPVAEIFDERP